MHLCIGNIYAFGLHIPCSCCPYGHQNFSFCHTRNTKMVHISIASWLKTHETHDHIAKRSWVRSMYHSLLIFFSYQPLKRLLILDRGGMTKSLFPYIIGIVLFGKRKSKASSSSNIISFEVTHMKIIFNLIFNVHMGFSVSILTMIIRSNT